MSSQIRPEFAKYDDAIIVRELVVIGKVHGPVRKATRAQISMINEGVQR